MDVCADLRTGVVRVDTLRTTRKYYSWKAMPVLQQQPSEPPRFLSASLNEYGFLMTTYNGSEALQASATMRGAVYHRLLRIAMYHRSRVSAHVDRLARRMKQARANSCG